MEGTSNPKMDHISHSGQICYGLKWEKSYHHLKVGGRGGSDGMEWVLASHHQTLEVFLRTQFY